MPTTPTLTAPTHTTVLVSAAAYFERFPHLKQQYHFLPQAYRSIFEWVALGVNNERLWTRYDTDAEGVQLLHHIEAVTYEVMERYEQLNTIEEQQTGAVFNHLNKSYSAVFDSTEQLITAITYTLANLLGAPVGYVQKVTGLTWGRQCLYLSVQTFQE